MTGPVAVTVEVTVPEIGADGPIRVGQWLVAAGERTSEGDRLVELVADGVLWNVPSPAAGTVLPPRLAAGRTARVGETLGTIRPD